jgi:hypothetical protein
MQKLVYVITQHDGKSYWNRAGVAFTNKDGSINFKLDVHGDTQFQIREQKEKTDGNKS